MFTPYHQPQQQQQQPAYGGQQQLVFSGRPFPPAAAGGAAAGDQQQQIMYSSSTRPSQPLYQRQPQQASSSSNTMGNTPSSMYQSSQWMMPQQASQQQWVLPPLQQQPWGPGQQPWPQTQFLPRLPSFVDPQYAASSVFPRSASAPAVSSFAGSVLSGPAGSGLPFSRSYQMLQEAAAYQEVAPNISPIVVPRRLSPAVESPRTKRKRVPATSSMRSFSREEEEEEDSASCFSSSEDSEDKPSRSRRSYPLPCDRKPKFGLGGQKRLTITFSDLGELIPDPEKFGKYGLVIPNGLCGVHQMFGQEWRFGIKYNNNNNSSTEGEPVLLTWTVQNLSSGFEVSMTESPQQAQIRRIKGKTVCNIVVKRALEQRATELETSLQRVEGNPMQQANLESLIKKLRPRQCTEGLLFFGLRHDIVQNRFKNQAVVQDDASSAGQVPVSADVMQEADKPEH